jgi:hypothetical protein
MAKNTISSPSTRSKALMNLIRHILKFRRDLFIVLFFIYCLALSYEFKITNVYDLYDSNLITVLAIILPSLLILDVGLRDEGRSLVAYVIVAATLIAWFVGEIRGVFVIVVLLILLYHFSKDNPRKGVFVVLASIALLVTGLVLCEGLLNLLGASSTQVVFISGVSIFVVLLWRRT